MERSFPWEDGDPPDQALLMQVAQALHGRWRDGDVMAPPQCACSSPFCVTTIVLVTERSTPAVVEIARTFAGPPGCETVGTDIMGPGDSAADYQSLDLVLTDITQFSSYSKLWRMLYFVNDEPFRIRNHGRGAGEG